MSTTDIDFLQAAMKARQGNVAQVQADCAQRGFVPAYLHSLIDALGLRQSGDRYMSEAEYQAAVEAHRPKPAARTPVSTITAARPPAPTSISAAATEKAGPAGAWLTTMLQLSGYNADEIDRRAAAAGYNAATLAAARKHLCIAEAGTGSNRAYGLPPSLRTSTATLPTAPSATYTAPASAPKAVHPERAQREQALLRMPEARGAEQLVGLLAANSDLSLDQAKDCLLVAQGRKPRFEKRSSAKAPTIDSSRVYRYREACAAATREGKPVPSWDEFMTAGAKHPGISAGPTALYAHMNAAAHGRA